MVFGRAGSEATKGRNGGAAPSPPDSCTEPRRRPSAWQFATAGLSNAPAAKLERDRQITQKHGGPWATACGMLSKGPPGGNFDGARRCVCPRAADQLLAERKMSKSDSAAAPSAGQSVTHPLAPWLSKRAPPNGSKIRGGRRELLRAKSRPRGRLLRPAASNLGVFGARRVAARSFRTQTRQASVFFFFFCFSELQPLRGRLSEGQVYCRRGPGSKAGVGRADSGGVMKMPRLTSGGASLQTA
ncbi:hypothetical protein ERJ75_000069900 [Trypanosoma vivax]|nr:hypothetical protein ERJ75_000069900 [Trypanosoma vivax]